MDNKTKLAVLVSTEKQDGNYLVRLDDVENTGAATWKEFCFYTHKAYPNSAFEEFEFNEKELADFGAAVLARLYAFNKNGNL